jgi:rubrerythrin
MSIKLNSVPHQAPIEITLFDFAEEEAKKQENLQQEKAKLEAEVNRMLRQTAHQLRNVAVNEEWKGSGERDKVLDENDELQKRIAATREQLQQANERQPDALLPKSEDKAQTKGELYTGPSVMSYSLAGRNAYSLPVPVYKCENGGVVVVLIAVTPRGAVTVASIDAKQSAGDPCIQEAAKRAALLSLFSASASPKNQQGAITYRFVPQ